MALSEIDRNLLDRCLASAPRAWEDFVDRYMGLVVHVINHTAQARSLRLLPTDQEDLAGEVFLTIVANNYATLRQFRGDCSLATYLTVVARRVVVAQMVKNKKGAPLSELSPNEPSRESSFEQRLSDREEIERLLEDLEGAEAEVVRLYHIEGKSYGEISSAVGLAENSIGPTLSRARQKLRRAGQEQESRLER